MSTSSLILETDGASRGNPGLAGAGVKAKPRSQPTAATADALTRTSAAGRIRLIATRRPQRRRQKKVG